MKMIQYRCTNEKCKCVEIITIESDIVLTDMICKKCGKKMHLFKQYTMK